MSNSSNTYLGNLSINVNTSPGVINVIPATSNTWVSSGSSSISFVNWNPDPEPKRKLPPPFQLTLDSDLFHLTTEDIKNKFKFYMSSSEEKKAEKEFYKNLEAWKKRNKQTDVFKEYGVFTVASSGSSLFI